MKSIVSAVALAVIAIVSANPALAGNTGLTSQVFPRDSVVFARTYGDWSAAWWQWAFSIPVSSNPLLDHDCNTGQSGPVFFLAGNITGGSSERNCTVPAGKSLFFPVLNQIFTSFPAPLTLINEMRAIDASAMDSATGMLVDLDGKQLNNLQNDFRVTSVTFDVTLPDDNLFGIPSGEYATAVDDGFYVMLKPLSAGSHTLHFKGTVSLTGFSLDVVYHLTQQ